jgi:acyl-homoserine lactone synthase
MLARFSGSDEPLYPHLFHQMYRQRHDIYVKRRKWRDLRPLDDLEKDRYDTENATYLLALDDRECVLAGLRLLPTLGPHLFADVFSHLAQYQPVPRGRNISELTRFYVAGSNPGRRERRRLVGVLAAGLFEHCLERGIRQLTSVVDTFLLPQMLALGWPVRKLGAAERYGEGSAVGVEIEITPTALEITRQRSSIDRPVLVPGACAEPAAGARTCGPL